jgi:hypothetical protein
MLARLGSHDCVPAGQRIAPARSPVARPLLALPSSAGPDAPYSAPDTRDAAASQASSTTYRSARVDGRWERACEAYRAMDLVQPRPGLLLRVIA